MKDQQIVDLIHELDPARSHDVGLLDFRAEADLAKIMAVRRRRTAPQWAIVVATVAVVAATVLVVARPWSVTQEAPVDGRPPMLTYEVVDERPAPTQLLEFAERVRALPPEPATGPVQRIVTEWGGTSGEVHSDGTVITRWESEHVERFILAGNTYTPTSTGYDQPFRVDFPAGVSTDPATLRRQLASKMPGGNSTAPFLGTIEDLHRETIPGPALRAAILTVLAGEPNVVAEGKTTDRAGRRATAYSWTDAYGERHIWLFDARTGVLLAIEEAFTGQRLDPSPDPLNPRPKAKPTAAHVTGYEVFTTREYLAKLPR